MNVALVAILLILAPLSMSAPTEVPVVEEFHNAMMNSYNTSDGMMFNTEDKDVVDALNVTSDTVTVWNGHRVIVYDIIHDSNRFLSQVEYNCDDYDNDDDGTLPRARSTLMPTSSWSTRSTSTL